MKTATGLMIVAAVGLLAVQAQGATYQFVFGLDGAQVPLVTPGTGTGIVDYDDVSNLLEWEITFQDLLADTTIAHFHGPAAPGVNAPPTVTIPGSPTAYGTTSGTFIGSATITEQHEADLLAGLWYVNIHTEIYPNGEIRGQVVPEPASLGLLALGGAAALLRRRR